MVEESVDQLKKQRAIEHVELAISDLQRFQSNPIIVNSIVTLHDAMVVEYNSLYAAKPVEDEKAHPTTGLGNKEPMKEPGKEQGKAEQKK